MADMTRIKGRIAETIYPNGTGAITAESHQALLLEMVDTINREKADQSELVATQESLEALTDTVNNLPQGGGDVKADGVYPDLTAGDLAGRGESVPAEFGFRASGGKSIKDGRAYIKRIKGNSVVWNQQIKNATFADASQWTSRRSEFRIEGGVAHIKATGEFSNLIQVIRPIVGHTYLVVAEAKGNVGYNLSVNFCGGGDKIVGGFTSDFSLITCTITYSSNAQQQFQLYCYESDAEWAIRKVQVIDLTQMFQEGNEPTTIEEFNARVATLGVDMNAYNEGEVIHCNTESIKSVGDNAWDEQWRQGFFVDGQYVDSPTQICSKNPIQVLPNESYRINQEHYYVWYYDKDMQFIGYDVRFSSETFVTPSNAAYIHFNLEPPYGTAYKNDIIVTLVHSDWKQGYQPYWQDILPLPIIRKYFPDGMKLAGTAHDEIRFNKASGKWEKVEAIGIRVYQEGDADNAAYLTDGKVTCYPLAEPIVTEITEDFRDYYQVADFGTEMSQSSVPSAPFSADIIYQFNAVDMIREHELEITELQKVIETMQAQLTSLINGGQ